MNSSRSRRSAQRANDEAADYSKPLILVEHDDFFGPGYTVVFHEGGGLSVLAREAKKSDAERRARHFRAELAAGHLLREDPSVWR